MTSRVMEMSRKELWRAAKRIHVGTGLRNHPDTHLKHLHADGVLLRCNSSAATHPSTSVTASHQNLHSQNRPVRSGEIQPSEISTSLPSRDAYYVCNHNLDRLGSLDNQGSLSKPFISCGKCNILGNYDLRETTSTRSKSKLPNTSSISMYSPLLSTSYADTNWLVVRGLHTTSRHFKEESKAEKTVKALKDEAKVKSESPDTPSSPTPTATEPTVEKEPQLQETTTVVAPVKKSIGQRIIAEVKHYYHGFRLLFLDVRVCIRSIWQVMNGKSLSRRERRQLVRTTSDLFRLVPFLVFVVVPFMEFLLPVAVKLFPGMLPSTFANENKEQEKIRKKLKVKLEMAKFLQDTIEETALTRKGAKGESVQDFVSFMEKIRTTGAETTNEEIMKYSKVFDEEITLEHLDYAQLQALMRLLDIPVMGTSHFMRFRLRMKLRQLETDDRMIMKEGVDNMAVWELQEACRSRGMRALGVPKEKLQYQLDQWLDLHLKENIPTSLLLLSRALYLPEQLSKEEQLKATISALPEIMDDEAKVKISEVSGDRVDHKTKLELLKQEEEAIRKEAEEESKKAEEEEAKKAMEEAKKQEELLVDRAEEISEPPDVIKAAAESITPSMVDSTPELKPSTEEILVDKAEVLDEKAEISKSDLEEIEDVLEKVAEEKDVDLEKEELDALKEDVSEYKEALEDLREVVLSTKGGTEELEESKSAKRLSKKVNKMVSQMDAFIQGLNTERHILMEDIEINEVKIKRSSDDMRVEMQQAISEKRKNVVSINELLLGIRRIQKVPDDTKFQRIAEVLDEDRDGVIDINDALRVIELLGRENVSIQADQMTELMDLLRREDAIELEEKEEKLREKVEKQKQQEENAASNDTTETPSGGTETPTPPREGSDKNLRERKEQKQ